MFGIMHHLKITMCEDSADATHKGYDYKGKSIKPVEISEVVVVKRGTLEGNATVDLLLEDQQGQKFVVMLTGNLLKSIPC